MVPRAHVPTRPCGAARRDGAARCGAASGWAIRGGAAASGRSSSAGARPGGVMRRCPLVLHLACRYRSRRCETLHPRRNQSYSSNSPARYRWWRWLRLDAWIPPPRAVSGARERRDGRQGTTRRAPGNDATGARERRDGRQGTTRRAPQNDATGRPKPHGAIAKNRETGRRSAVELERLTHVAVPS
jgi:hypothetical protein